jgi:glycosyltransferase involved in cell wall biosynthesis
MTVRLYGRVTNWGSHAQVTEGCRIALEHHGVLAGLFPVDLAVDEDRVPGREARVALLTGPLTTLGQLSPTHTLRAAVVAPNSSRIPPALAKSLSQNLHLVLAPSAWAAGVLRGELTGPTVITVPHGVHPDMRVSESRRDAVLKSYWQGHFDVVHFSTTDRGRKGTLELVRAWPTVAPPGARLVLVLDENAQARLLDDCTELGIRLNGPAIKILHRLELPTGARVGAPPAAMACFLAAFHCVIQPSRGEGFGLVPLEARACGVPVIATTEATGHLEHLYGTGVADGVVPVAVGPDAPIDDVPGATAPSLTPAAIGEAIQQAHRQYKELHENAIAMAERVREQWAWPAVIRPFLEEINR